MIEASFTLEGVKREDLTKGATKTFRSEGKIPGVVCRAGKDSVPVAVDAKAFKMNYQRGDIRARLVNITLEGGESFIVLPKEIQTHPVNDNPLHIDFTEITPGKKVVVPVGVKFTNAEKSPGIKRGGTLNIVRREVMLLCDPEKIPNILTANLDGLKIGQSVHISAITLPEGCEPVIRDRDFTICTIAGKGGKAQKEDEEGEGGEEGEGAAA